jgi:CPA2 family monovalent cation:H+ antiporter-2
MDEVHALTSVIILLVVGIIAISVMRRIGLSPIVGYLLAGVLIGPHALGLIEENPTTHLLAELGVVFLLFDIGLHFTLANIWEARRDIFGLGPLQILLCGAAFGGIAIALGVEPHYAVILGGALALSSTAVVVQTIAERGQRNCPVGLTGTAVLIFQDICAIFLLILAASLETDGQSVLATLISLAMLKAAVAFLAAILIGRYVIKPVFRALSQTRNEEIFTAMALLVVLATAVATESAGLSLTLGAFLGGMMISETAYRHVIQTEAKPFRNLLLAFFFITVGMSLDWTVLLSRWAEILAFLAAFIAIKTVLVAAAAGAVGWSLPGSMQLGALLAQGSEFIFVIIAVPAVRSALGESAVGIVITGIALSLLLTPTIASAGNRLARVLQARFAAPVATHEATPGAGSAPVIVFGMGDIGRSVADALEAHELSYEALERDHDRFLSASADGYPVGFGDLTDIRLLETLAYGEREAIVITIDREEMAQALPPTLHEHYPNLVCFVVVDTSEEKDNFEALGFRPVFDRSIPRGLDLAAAVLRSQNVSERKIANWMRREQERAMQAMDNRRREVDVPHFDTPHA